MSVPGQPESATRKLLESGIIFSIISFGTGLINFGFQGLIGRQLTDAGEFGLANSTTGLTNLLGIPLLVATTAITHYIAHFQGKGQEAHLRGLLLGCRKVLLWFTVGGSIGAIILVAPLSKFFGIPRYSLTIMALVCVLAGLWGSFATALCQGLSWFKRLAIIGLMSATLRCVFTWFVARQHPVAEVAVASTAVAVLANLVLFGNRRKEIFQHGEAESPWNWQFVVYLVIGAACVGGNYFFLQSDPLVALRNFGSVKEAIDNYSIANRLAQALPMVAGPLLVVLFTARSRESSGDAAAAQLKLMGLYTVGLLIGVAGLLALNGFCVRLIRGQASPQAEMMLARLAWTMVFSGLLQALGTWALASRWIKVTLLYGVLGLVYWSSIMVYGTTPERLLTLMPIVSGGALVILLVAWLVAMKQQKSM